MNFDRIPSSYAGLNAFPGVNDACYRFLLTAIGQIGFITNVSGHVIEDSPGWQTYTGKTLNDLKNHPWTALTHPDERENAHSTWKRHLESKNVSHMEVRLRAEDGEYRTFLLRGVPVLKADGRVHEWAAACFDVQDYKNAEMLLKEKTIALKEMLGQLEIEKKILVNQICKNVEKLVLPALKKLGKNATTIENKYIELLEANLKDVTGEFGVVMTETKNLTPKEIEICNMIRNGLRTKEIAKLLKISALTVNTHRTNIRKKLKISREKVNLSSHLK